MHSTGPVTGRGERRGAGEMLSDTQLALASRDTSLHKLAKGKRKKENAILRSSRKNPGGVYSGKRRVILILITHSHWVIQEDVLKKPDYNERQTRAGVVRLQVSVHDKSPGDVEKGQRHTFETGIRKCSGLKLAGHGQRDTLGNQRCMVGIEVEGGIER